MASPLIFNQFPIHNITFFYSSGNKPSAFGATFRSIQPFLLTISIKTSTILFVAL